MTAQRPRNEVRHADYPRGFTRYTEVMCKAANRATALSKSCLTQRFPVSAL